MFNSYNFTGCDSNFKVFSLKCYKLIQMKQIPCIFVITVICTRKALENFNNNDQHFPFLNLIVLPQH